MRSGSGREDECSPPAVGRFLNRPLTPLHSVFHPEKKRDEDMAENRPSIADWRKLYDTAVRLKQMAPWEWMEEIDLFGVENPETGELGFVSVMGMAGEHFAVSLYLGAEGLHGFLELQRAGPVGPPERLMEIPQLQASFESRDLLDEEDYQVVKELGLRFRGPHAWPLFRSYMPGFLPWFIEAEEARWLTCALEQTLEVASRLLEDSYLLPPADGAGFLMRTGSWRGAEFVWKDEYRDVPPPEPTSGDARDDFLLLSRFKKLPRGDRVFEADLFMLWSAVQEGEGRPYYPYALMVVDATSGIVFDTELLTPEPSLEAMWSSVPLRLMQLFEKLNGIPREVRMRSQKLLDLLRSVAGEQGFELKLEDSLTHLDQARRFLHRSMAGDSFDPDDDFFGEEDFEAGDEFEVEEGFVEENFGADEDSEVGEEEYLPKEEYPLDALDNLSIGMRALDLVEIPADVEEAFKQILGDQVIDENGPGTVLRDFGRLLEAVGPEGIELTGAKKQPRAKFAAELNERLEQTIEIGVRRPLPRSFPNVSGLYLLLRASGLGVRDGKRLVLDPEVLSSWNQLNDTERYFTLLESWLLRGSREILGEFANHYNTPLSEWIRFWTTIPDQGLQVAGNRGWAEHINYNPGLPNLSLMGMFGLLRVKSGQPKPGKGWRVEKVERTSFGDALRLCLIDYLGAERERPAGERRSVGRMQEIFQPFFPEWQELLRNPEEEFTDGIFVFKVSLGRIWRRLAIPAQSSLDLLSSAILDAFEFDYDHLYCFTVENRSGISFSINHPVVREPPFTNQVRVGDLPLAPGAIMIYLFDFGDNWEFEVKLERIEPADARRRKAVVLDAHGRAPEQYPDAEW